MYLTSLLKRNDGGVPIDRSVQTWDYVCQSLCIVGMTVCFGLRLYTRMFILNGFGKEDWACAMAWVLGVCYSVIAIIMGHFGGGLHYWDVPAENDIPFAKTVYVTMVMYGPTAFLTKVCLLWIMTRVFSPFRKSVIFIYVFMGVMLAYYIPAVIVKIRICSPIAKFWDKSIEGTCLDESSIILADAVVSVVSDLIILILPVPLTLTLQMSSRKKLRVMGLLGAGGVAVASSIIRLALIIITAQSTDMTLAFMRVNMLGNAEVAIGVICACLPALSALIMRSRYGYSSDRTGHTSDYKMNSMRNGTKTDSSRRQISVRELESDEDGLVYNAQGNPGTETNIHGDTGRDGNLRNLPHQGIGITRTIDVSTSMEPR